MKFFSFIMTIQGGGELGLYIHQVSYSQTALLTVMAILGLLIMFKT